MANRVRGEVAFKLGGKEYTMVFNHGALVELEDKLDMGIVAITTEMQRWSKEPQRVRLKWVGLLMWAGLLKYHKLTVEEAGELLDTASAEGVNLMEIIGDSMSKAYGETEKKDSSDARPTNGEYKSGSGTQSSQSLSRTDSPSRDSGISLHESSK
jgi:hypothetical protein